MTSRQDPLVHRKQGLGHWYGFRNRTLISSLAVKNDKKKSCQYTCWVGGIRGTGSRVWLADKEPRSTPRSLNTKLQQNKRNLSWKTCFIAECTKNEGQDILQVKQISEPNWERQRLQNKCIADKTRCQVYLNILQNVMPMVFLSLLGTEVTLNVRKEYLIQFEILRGRKNSEQTESISKKIIYTSSFRANMANQFFFSDDEFIYSPNNLFLMITRHTPTQNSFPCFYRIKFRLFRRHSNSSRLLFQPYFILPMTLCSGHPSVVFVLRTNKKFHNSTALLHLFH